MLCEAPNRLHWVRVRDALADLQGWERVCVTGARGEAVDIQTIDRSALTLTCARLTRFPDLLDDSLPHEAGGRLAFWNRRERVLAIPEASACTSGARAVISSSAVIIEDGRDFELVAGDSTWRMRLFDARVPERERPRRAPARR